VENRGGDTIDLAAVSASIRRLGGTPGNTLIDELVDDGASRWLAS